VEDEVVLHCQGDRAVDATVAIFSFCFSMVAWACLYKGQHQHMVLNSASFIA
jgi:mannose/cellobiose epimerase-like protein (N-acyl-D-glucosamine 2-epimerase family)